MKLLGSTVVFVAVASATLIAARWRGDQAPSAGREGDRRVLYYIDPMNPTHTSDKPGFAPCGMKLEPVYAEEDGTPAPATAPAERKCCAAKKAGKVRLDGELQQLMGVHVESVGPKSDLGSSHVFGRVLPDERHVFHLTSGVEGVIRETFGFAVGSLVRKGDCLATFRAPDTRTTVLGYLTAVDIVDRQIAGGSNTPEQLAVIQENVRLGADRLLGLGISQGQIDEITATRSVPSLFKILAPTDGTIIAHEVTPELKFQKAHEWFRIADLRKVWVMADMAPEEAAGLQPGTEVAVRLSPGDESLSLTARVADTLPQFDPNTRTLKVRLDVDNTGLQLRPDMVVSVIMPAPPTSRITVATDAVLRSGQSSTVFVEESEGTFAPRRVETGRVSGGRIEVLSGLQTGDRIVTSGLFLLDSESRIKQAASEQHAASL